MRSVNSSLRSIATLVFGLVSITVGFMTLFQFPAESRASTTLSELPIVDGRTLYRVAANTRIILEGRISAGNRTYDFDFVAYQREEYRGRRTGGSSFRNREIWQKDESQRPPLQISAAGTYLNISNSGYELDTPPSFHQTSDMLRWDGVANEGTKRYNGFRHNDQVAVVGVVQGSGRSRSIVAEVLHGGNAASYVAAQQQEASMMPFVGAGFVGFGLLLAGMALWRIMGA
jgi:hypothetical protein